jgi:hypothetical protein
LVLYRRERILDKKEGLLGRKGCLTLKIKLEYVQIFQPSVAKRGPVYACQSNESINCALTLHEQKTNIDF